MNYASEIKVTRIRETAPVAKCDSPEECVAYWHKYIAGGDSFQDGKEHLVVLVLDTRFHLVAHNLVSLGSINECIGAPREIMAPVICAGAYGFILMHNHPSGIPIPSEADKRLTRRMHECGKLLQIEMFDHVIIGDRPTDTPYYSFREQGMI